MANSLRDSSGIEDNTNIDFDVAIDEYSDHCEIILFTRDATSKKLLCKTEGVVFLGELSWKKIKSISKNHSDDFKCFIDRSMKEKSAKNSDTTKTKYFYLSMIQSDVSAKGQRLGEKSINHLRKYLFERFGVDTIYFAAIPCCYLNENEESQDYDINRLYRLWNYYKKKFLASQIFSENDFYFVMQ